MNTESLHIVHKLVVDVETNSKTAGYAIRDNAAGFVSGRLSPALESLFRELESKLNGKVLVLDQLKIDVSAKTAELTSSDIDELICKAIREEVKAIIPSATEPVSESVGGTDRQILPVAQRQLQAVFHFLQTGDRPWWIPDNASLSKLMETANLLELAQMDTALLAKELAADHSGNFLKRLVYQLPEVVLIDWLMRAFRFPENAAAIANVPQALFKSQATAVKKEVWELLLTLFRRHYRGGTIAAKDCEPLILLLANPEAVRPQLRKLKAAAELVTLLLGEKASPVIGENELKVLQQQDTATATETKVAKAVLSETGETENEESLTPVENAGLILLHPFLKPFFSATGLMEGNQFTDRELAAHALHFLATGKECDWEYELRFEKFLCGIPVEESIVREVIIPEGIKEEAGKLLAAVLEHWKGLKSDSVELLQHEFLQREAKIIREEHQTTRLVFERKTQDILLDSLPWNLGIVKVDWRKDLLFVEW